MAMDWNEEWLTDHRIILRAFQGIGAAGCMSCGIATMYDLVPNAKYPSYNAIITACSALGALLGPVVGGALSGAGQWRWAFLIK
jgi:MFS family permease